MKYLVIGGGGFIGSHICESLLLDNDEVILYDNFSRAKLLNQASKNTDYNANYLIKKFPSNLKIMKNDVLDYESLSTAAKNCDVIFNVAAQVAVTTSVVDPMTDFKTNTQGALNVLEAARKNNCAVIFTSTNKVYGNKVNEIQVKENEKRYSYEAQEGIGESFGIDHTHHSPYGCSKLAADLYVQEYHHQYGLKTGVFRMSAIYGSRQFGAEDQGWVSWMIIRSILNKVITIFGDGKQVRDLLYVTDLVDLFKKFLSSNLKHGVFNTGGGKENTLSILELLDLIEIITGKRPKTEFSNWRPADQKVYISDISKLEKTLNWKPETSPKEGVKNLIDWVEKNKSLFSDL